MCLCNQNNKADVFVTRNKSLTYKSIKVRIRNLISDDYLKSHIILWFNPNHPWVFELFRFVVLTLCYKNLFYLIHFYTWGAYDYFLLWERITINIDHSIIFEWFFKKYPWLFEVVMWQLIFILDNQYLIIQYKFIVLMHIHIQEESHFYLINLKLIV